MPFAGDATTYLITPPGAPFDRLEAFHEALRTVAGASHLAPVGNPSRILDVGIGLNHWLGEIGVEFPGALLIAAQTDPLLDGQAPAGVVTVRADLAGGLPFPDGAFEYVHHRGLPFGVRADERAHVLDELVRMLAPGAWIEIVATEPAMLPRSPATERLQLQVRRLLDLAPDISPPEPLPPLLRARGLVDVDARRFELPLGSWGGPVGEAMLSNLRAVVGVLASALEARLQIPTIDTLGMVARSTEEIEEGRTVVPVWFVWGRRAL